VAGPPEAHCAVYIRSVVGDRLWQGEILQNVLQLKPSLDSIQNPGGEIEVLQVTHDFAIVMSQDCDLFRDHKRRQEGAAIALPNILLCDLYHAEVLRAKINAEDQLGRKEWKKLIAPNQSERFQYLQKVEANEDLQGEGMPALAIDFRLYFTIPTDELYHRLTQEIRRRARLNSPYIEHLAHRFFKFQGRVALPSDHAIDAIPD
jgi:hypothetical protein